MSPRDGYIGGVSWGDRKSMKQNRANIEMTVTGQTPQEPASHRPDARGGLLCARPDHRISKSSSTPSRSRIRWSGVRTPPGAPAVSPNPNSAGSNDSPAGGGLPAPVGSYSQGGFHVESEALRNRRALQVERGTHQGDQPEDGRDVPEDRRRAREDRAESRPLRSEVVLDLCGGTGSWSEPYRLAGYDVRLVSLPDLDVLTYRPPKGVHGILAAPPCDHFSVSGAQYWKAKDADGRTAAALAVVDACLRIIREASPKWWALENPIGRLRSLRGDALGPVSLAFDPCDYGDPWTKRTLLWGRFCVPMHRPVQPVRSTSQGSWLMALGGKSERTKRLRSMTPPGFAQAFFEANP